ARRAGRNIGRAAIDLVGAGGRPVTVHPNRLQRQWILVRRWLRSSGRDVVDSTRESVGSLEAKTGAILFAAFWVAGLLGRGAPLSSAADAEIVQWARRSSPGWVVAWQALSLVLHVLVGLSWGVVFRNAWDLVGDLWKPFRRGHWTLLRQVAVTALGVFVFHAAVWLRDVGRHPALYLHLAEGRWAIARGAYLLMADGRPIWLRWPLQGVAFLGLAAAGLNVVRRVGLWFWGFNRPTRLAIAVLGSFLALSAVGFRAVWRAQLTPSAGPNAVVVVVDGLRSDRLFRAEGGSPAPRLVRWMARGRSFTRCVPPAADADLSLMTFLTGQTPLRHGFRSRWASAGDARLGAEALPLVLRANEFRTGVLTDAGGDLYGRLAEEFDEVRAPARAARSALLRRALEGSLPLLPYLSGRVGRSFFPPLRGSGVLADPDLLTGEAADWLHAHRFESRFVLLVHVSVLTECPAPVNARAWSAWRSRAGDASAGGSAFDERRLYDANLAALDHALGGLADALKTDGFEENTLVAVWSPRGAALSPEDREKAAVLSGPVFDAAPFALMEPHLRSGARRLPGFVRAHDVAPTLMDELRLPVPEAMEGVPVFEGAPAVEDAAVAYSETDGLTDGPFPLPSAARLTVEDRDAPGRLTLDPANVDRVLVGKRRALRWPGETLLYVPTRDGVRFHYFREDSPGSGDLSGQRAWTARIKDLKEIFYRYLSREAGWRPQNEYWLPEAFLREETFDEEDPRRGP
nr:sulfatase-like hydrolase/transferase [Elusimicrobiota bacterium]